MFVAAAALATACSTNELGRVEAQSTGDLEYGEPAWVAFDAEFVDACGAGGATAAGETRLLRRPYLQCTQADATMLAWTSSTDEAATVVVTDPSRGAREVARARAWVDTSASVSGGNQWIANISGLEPGQTYCYAIVAADGETLVAPTGFRTAPETGSDAPVRFVTLGDLGTRTDEQFQLLEQLERVRSDFALINGDVAYTDGTRSQIERNFFDVYKGMLDNIPFFVASGNHDYNTDNARPFREAFVLFENGGPDGVERWYSYDWGNVHVVALDTQRMGAEQAAWLDADLAANQLPWVVVTAHKPAYSSGYHGNDADVHRYFVPLFEKYGVQLVIAGHDHHYERINEINGVTYLVTGAGGRGTRSVGSSWFTAFAEQVTHFTHVVIDGDEMILRAIDATGQVFDTARITR